jgi:hypothetical protein
VAPRPTINADFRLLCDAPHLNALRVLNVAGAGLTVESGIAFAEGSGLPALTELNLGPAGYRTNRLGFDGLRALVAGARSGRLRKLNLADNFVEDSGVEALCAQPHLCNLTHLNLASNQLTNRLTNRAAVALAGAAHLATLEYLNLSGNALTGDGARALAKSPNLNNIQRLILPGHRLGAAADALRARFGAALVLI